jgi:hypothetical protein
MDLKKLPKHRLSVIALFCALVVATMLLGTPLAIADTCIEEQAGKSVACSANDVRVTFADNVRNTFGAPLAQCIKGQRISFIADFHVRTTAISRYDIGLYFATDGDPNGDGARSGLCSANIITDRHIDPAFPKAVMLGATASADLDGDACRDINSAYGWRHIEGKIVTLRVDDVLCHDSDGDGKLNLPNCTSWSQNSGGVCTSPQNAVPSSPANCSCDIGFNVPIFVSPGSIQVTKDDRAVSSVKPASDLSLLSEPTPPQDSQP